MMQNNEMNMLKDAVRKLTTDGAIDTHVYALMSVNDNIDATNEETMASISASILGCIAGMASLVYLDYYIDDKSVNNLVNTLKSTGMFNQATNTFEPDISKITDPNRNMIKDIHSMSSKSPSVSNFLNCLVNMGTNFHTLVDNMMR